MVDRLLKNGLKAAGMVAAAALLVTAPLTGAVAGEASTPGILLVAETVKEPKTPPPSPAPASGGVIQKEEAMEKSMPAEMPAPRTRGLRRPSAVKTKKIGGQIIREKKEAPEPE
jgi:hypothetical protein